MWNNTKFTNKYNELTKQAFSDMLYRYLPVEGELDLVYGTLKECASASLAELELLSHKITPKKWWKN